MKFQEKILFDTTYLRIKYPLTPYPCYHQGLYLEEFFCNFFIKNCLDKEYSRYYLPIFWTNMYQRNWIHGYVNPVIECYLNTIPKDKKYFTVCQHDDAPMENVDFLDIDVYSAGGNYAKGIPIPLICSKMPSSVLSESKKSILCSFVASNTHPVREKVVDYCKKHDIFYVSSKTWKYDVNKTEFEFYVDILKKSIFTICARGYGKQSYRFYEALQMNSIPVYVYDNEPYLPFSNEINYNDFAIVLNVDDIDKLKDILLSKTEEDIKSMVKKGKEIYDQYFTLDKVTSKVIDLVGEL